jgi:hypothetical protein
MRTLVIGLVIVLSTATRVDAGGRLTLEWDPSPDTDIARYVLSYGNIPGTYTTDVDVGLQTTFEFDVPDDGLPYYFAVRAVNTSDVSSVYSNEVAIRPPVLLQPPDQSGVVGTFASLQLHATDPDEDPITYGASGLPPGLSIDSVFGVISGTLPSTPGSHLVTASASDRFTTVYRTFTWTVTSTPGGNRPPVLLQPPDQSGVVGTFASLQLYATDPDEDSITYGATGLPPGLSIEPTSGLISGTPSTSGNYVVTASAADSSFTVYRTFTWTITDPPTGGIQIQVNGVSPPSVLEVDQGAIVSAVATGRAWQPGDWFGLFRPGGSDLEWIAWVNADFGPLSSLVGLMGMTLGPGDFEIRLLDNEGRGLATSARIVVR